jgi:hypothetical protein
MKTSENKRPLIKSTGTLFWGVFLLIIFIINRTPTEVFNSNISFSDISMTSMPGGMSASYRYYKNYDEADSHADTVLIGDVIKVNDPKELITGEVINTINGEKETISHIYTVSEVKVSKVIKGKCLPGDIIKIKQLGGAYKEFEYDEHNMYGTMYYQKGERYIFFLQSYENSPCSTINPQQGDMLIKDGKIKARNKVQFIKESISEDLAIKALRERVEALKVRDNKNSK